MKLLYGKIDENILNIKKDMCIIQLILDFFFVLFLSCVDSDLITHLVRVV